MFNAMTRAEIWLQDTLDKPLGIEDLANHIGYSASQVRRQFRHCFNISPSAYREKRRLERAAVLLSLTQHNIAHIGSRCGYLNHSSFSRAFQRHYQLTPRQYRQALKGLHHLQSPKRRFSIKVEKNRPRQTVLMRLYQAPENIKGLGGANYHGDHLKYLQAQLGTSMPTVSLPDLLTEQSGAPREQTKASYRTRTDIGLYLENQESASHLALPVAYRRVDLPTHYYATTCLEDFSELSEAMSATLIQLIRHQNHFHISGEAPRVLWHQDHLELQTPLLI